MRGGVVAAIAMLMAVAAGPASRPAGSRVYDCRRVAEGPVVDGDLTDGAWAGAEWGEEFVDLRTGGKAGVRTRAKMVWDERCLYIAAELDARDVRASAVPRDTMIYATDHVFELFLDPDGDGREYAEIQVNAGNVVMDLVMDKPYVQRGWYDVKWDVEGMQSAIAVEGTVNDASDVDRCWRVEMALPWEGLKRLTGGEARAPEAGMAWRVQLARAEHGSPATPAAGKERPKPAYSAWSPQPERNLHAPHLWGTLRFSGPRAPSPRAGS